MEELVHLCKEHAAFENASFDINTKKENLAHFLFETPGVVDCIVVENNGKLLGYASFMKQFSTWKASYYLYLDCLYLRPEIRGQGIGKELMNKIRNHAKEQNCAQVQWQTPSFNQRAIAFYKSLGSLHQSKERFCWEIE